MLFVNFVLQSKNHFTMTTTTSQSAHSGSRTRSVLIGAAIALVMIAIFLIMGGPGEPEWGRWWKLRPLAIVTFAGAAGGLFYHLMGRFRSPGGWQKVLVNVLCLLVYIVGLWLGSILGLAGTWWD